MPECGDPIWSGSPPSASGVSAPNCRTIGTGQSPPGCGFPRPCRVTPLRRQGAGIGRQSAAVQLGSDGRVLSGRTDTSRYLDRAVVASVGSAPPPIRVTRLLGDQCRSPTSWPGPVDVEATPTRRHRRAHGGFVASAHRSLAVAPRHALHPARYRS